MSIDYSLTGPIANHARPPVAHPPTLVPGSAPNGRRPPDGFHWDQRFADDPQLQGFIPDVWGIMEVLHQAALQEGRRQWEAEAPARKAELERRAQEEAAEHERTRPRTMDERIDALEARIALLDARLAKLTAPTRIKGPASSRSSRAMEGGQLPPAA